MSELTDETINEAYSAALRYGPEPFNHEDRAHYLTTEKRVKFLMEVANSDFDDRTAYYAAGKYGVSICCVDWIQDVAEESKGLHSFCEALIEGYETPDTTGYYVCLTEKGQRVSHHQDEQDAIEEAGRRRAETGEPHHYYDTSDEEVNLDEV